MATSVFMVASPWRAARRAATRKRRPNTNWTMVAGISSQRLTSTIGHGVPPGQNITAIIARPMAVEAIAATAARAGPAAACVLVRGPLAAVSRSAAGLVTDLVARGRDGGHDPGAIDGLRIEADRRPLGREIDARTLHAIGPVQEALDAVHAAGAGHSVDGQRQLGGEAGRVVIACSGYYRGVLPPVGRPVAVR